MAKTHVDDLVVAEGLFHFETQDIVGNGAITIKNGVVRIAKTVPGVVTVTLAKPTADDDDFKRLTVISNQTQANTLAITAGSFGGGGGGEDLATASGVVGDTLALMAYQGEWYVTGYHQWTLT